MYIELKKTRLHKEKRMITLVSIDWDMTSDGKTCFHWFFKVLMFHSKAIYNDV